MVIEFPDDVELITDLDNDGDFNGHRENARNVNYYRYKQWSKNSRWRFKR